MVAIEQSGNDKEREKSLLALLVLLNHWVHPSPQGLQGAKMKFSLKDQWKKRYTGMHVILMPSAINVCQEKNFINFTTLIGEILS